MQQLGDPYHLNTKSTKGCVELWIKNDLLDTVYSLNLDALSLILDFYMSHSQISLLAYQVPEK